MSTMLARTRYRFQVTHSWNLRVKRSAAAFTLNRPNSIDTRVVAAALVFIVAVCRTGAGRVKAV